MTYAEYAAAAGIKPDTIRIRTDRMRNAKELPDGTRYAANALIPDEVVRYFETKEAKQKTDTTGKAGTPRRKKGYATREAHAQTSARGETGKPGAGDAMPPASFNRSRIVNLVNKLATKKSLAFALLFVSVAIPVRNVYGVCSDLSGNIDAVLFTTVLTAIAPAFVWFGVRAWWGNILIAALIGFEIFANTARVYSGLMFSGKYQYPTTFLGNVTTMLGTRSHETALILALFFAVLAAGAQYSLIKYLKK